MTRKSLFIDLNDGTGRAWDSGAAGSAPPLAERGHSGARRRCTPPPPPLDLQIGQVSFFEALVVYQGGSDSESVRTAQGYLADKQLPHPP